MKKVISLVVFCLLIAVTFIAYCLLTIKTPSQPSSSPAITVITPFPSEVKSLFASASQISEFGISVELTVGKNTEDRLLALIGSEDDAFWARLNHGNLEFFRYQKGGVHPLTERPSLSGDDQSLCIVYASDSIIVYLDGQRITRPIVAPSYSLAWCDSIGTVHPLDIPFFSDSFSRTEGNGEWVVKSGRFQLRSFDFQDKTVNPGFLSAITGDEKSTTLDEQQLMDLRVGNSMVGFGMITEPHWTREHGMCLRVLRISGGSPASAAGIDHDFIILKINGRVAEAMYLMRIENGGTAETEFEILTPKNEKRMVKMRPSPFQWGAEIKNSKYEPYKEGDTESVAIIEGGRWTNYIFEASMRIRGNARGGLMLCVKGENHLRVYPRVLAPGTSQWVLERRAERKQAAIEIIGGTFPDNNTWFAVTLMPVETGAYRLVVDGVTIGLFDCSGFPFGGVGLFASGDGEVDFDDVNVSSLERYVPNWLRTSEYKSFSLDSHMSSWAANKGGRLQDGVFILDDGPFEDCVIELKVERGFELNLFSKDRISKGLIVRHDSENSLLVFEVDNKQISTCPVSLLQVENGLRFVRQQGGFSVQSGKTTIGSFQLPESLGAGYMNMLNPPKTDKGMVFSVNAPNLAIDNFNSAPSAWAVHSGFWGVTTRWSCDPRWAFFGGYGESTAMIASKYECTGDRYFDIYFAPPMIAHQSPWEKRGDFLFGFSTSYNDPLSGYLVHLAGECNRWSRLYKNGVLVASHDKYTLPQDTFEWDVEPVHKWYHVRFEVIGSAVRFMLDDNELFSFDDPKPIKTGRAVVGAIANGILIARSRVYGAQLNAASRALSPASASCTDFVPRKGDAKSKISFANDTVRVEQATSIGVPSIEYSGGAIDVEKNPYLHFFVARRGLPLDMYFECEGHPFRLSLSGDENEACDAEAVGHLFVEDTGTQIRIEFDIRGALEHYFPSIRGLKVSNIRFGCDRLREGEIAHRSTRLGWYSISSFMFRPYAKNMLAPAVEQVIQPFERPELGETLTLKISDPSNGGLKPQDAEYFINGKRIFFDRQNLRYDRDFRTLIFDLARLGFAAGEHSFEMRNLSAEGCGTLDNYQVKFNVDPTKDDIPPIVEFDNYIHALDFERAPLGVFPAADAAPLSIGNLELPFKVGTLGAAFVSRYGDAANGLGYLRVFNRGMGGSFGLGICNRPLDLMRSPILAFKYRCKKALPLDLVLRGDDFETIVPLAHSLSAASGGEWRKVIVDLTPYLHRNTLVKYIALADTGFQGCVRGEYYDIDAIRLVKVIPSFKWPTVKAYDLSGVAEIFVGLGKGQPAETPIADMVIPDNLDGLVEFSFAAVDSKGNSTVELHETVFVDSKPPRLEVVERRVDEVFFSISDNRGVVETSVSVQLQSGEILTVGRGITRIGELKFSFEWPNEEGGNFYIFASDYAGNRMNEKASVEDYRR